MAVAVPVSGIAGQSAFHTVSGLVVDATNGFVPGATVRLTNPASGATHEIKTDAAGRFELVGVPTAEYVLDVSQPGFARFRQGRLLIAGNLERTVELQVGSIEETVSVGTGAAGAAAVPIAAKLEEARARAEAAARGVAERCAGGSAASSSARAPGMGGNILAPRKLLDVYPEYPEHLQQAGVTGTVTLAARIGTDGRIVDIIATNQAHPELERAAIEAVRQWEFTPTYLNCTPIEVRMQVTANFSRPK
jgi:TonB family protein